MLVRRPFPLLEQWTHTPRHHSKDLAVPARRHKFTLIGTPQDKTFVDPSDVDPKMLPDVMDDFDVSCTLPHLLATRGKADDKGTR